MHFAARHFRGNPLRRSPVTVATVAAMMFFSAVAALCKCPQLLTLSIPALQNMRLWSLLTYPLAQQGLSAFIFNCISLLVLGSIVEKQWRGRQMITMLAAVTLMTGFTWLCIAKVLGSSEAISGITTLLFALLTVTAIIKRGERINLYGLGEMSLSMLCWIIIAITILLNLRSLPLLASASSVLWAFLFTAIARGKFSRASTLNSAHGSMSRFSDLD